MAISPLCTVNTFTTENGVDVAGGSTVTIQLADAAGVSVWSIQCLTTDDGNDKDDINSGLSINYITKTATFTAPLIPNGSAMIFESKVNNGVDANGRLLASLTTRFKVCVLTGGGNRLGAWNENMENNQDFGWLTIINEIARNSVISIGGLAGDGLTYSGGMYNVGAANDSITINADSIELKAAYKTLLDGATSSATANTLAKRGASAEIAFAAITNTTLTASGQITTTAASPSGISCPNGDTTSLRFAVTNLGSNILLARKNATLGTTSDIQSLNGYNLKIYTDGGTLDLHSSDATGSTTSSNVTLNSGLTVNGNSGTVRVNSGACSGSGISGNFTAGSGATSSGNAGSATFSGGNSSSAVGGSAVLKGGNTGQALTKGAPVSIVPGNGPSATYRGNVYLGIDAASVSGSSSNGSGNIFIANNSAGPSAAPVGGALIWFDGLSLWIRKPGSVSAQMII